MNYPRPEIGYYWSYCCLFDLSMIKTQDDLDDILESYENEEDDPTGLMIFPTLQAAIGQLGPDHTKEEIEATIERLSK